MEKLKYFLYSAPVLALHDFFKPFDLDIDAFDLAISSALMQLGHPIAYFSWELKPAERNYSTYDQEFLALFSAC